MGKREKSWAVRRTNTFNYCLRYLLPARRAFWGCIASATASYEKRLFPSNRHKAFTSSRSAPRHRTPCHTLENSAQHYLTLCPRMKAERPSILHQDSEDGIIACIRLDLLIVGKLLSSPKGAWGGMLCQRNGRWTDLGTAPLRGWVVHLRHISRFVTV